MMRLSAAFTWIPVILLLTICQEYHCFVNYKHHTYKFRTCLNVKFEYRNANDNDIDAISELCSDAFEG